VHAYTVNGRRLPGGNFRFDFPSVGATETLMLAACLADGESVLSNVAQVMSVFLSFFSSTFPL
jgi:UDP-N-acetylglucosamine enolpyruvyl transferase